MPARGFAPLRRFYGRGLGAESILIEAARYLLEIFATNEAAGKAKKEKEESKIR